MLAWPGGARRGPVLGNVCAGSHRKEGGLCREEEQDAACAWLSFMPPTWCQGIGKEGTERVTGHAHSRCLPPHPRITAGRRESPDVSGVEAFSTTSQ